MRVALTTFVFGGIKYEVGMPIKPSAVKEIKKVCPKGFTKDATSKEEKMILKHYGKLADLWELQASEKKKADKVTGADKKK